jgi:hypothetical protein
VPYHGKDFTVFDFDHLSNFILAMSTHPSILKFDFKLRISELMLRTHPCWFGSVVLRAFSKARNNNERRSLGQTSMLCGQFGE